MSGKVQAGTEAQSGLIIAATATMRPKAEIFIGQGSPGEGYFARGSVTAGDDSHTFVGLYDSQQEAIADVTGWALGWLRRLRKEPNRGWSEV